ncbi:MAG: antitoxin Xre-like helix-turn-helix domain-containing protein [Verrucomicrobiales bacterium]
MAVRELEELRARLDVPMDKLAGRLGISKATLHRRKISGKLDATQSDRVIRIACCPPPGPASVARQARAAERL